MTQPKPQLASSQIDRILLAKIAAESIAKIDPNTTIGKRWINAIGNAVAELEENPFMSYDTDSKSLLILSSTSGKTYHANGTCYDDEGRACKAFSLGQPCRHRATARLMALYVERAN